MPQKIDFYILVEKNPNSHGLFACHLIEKIFDQKHSIYLHTESQKEAETMNQLLWTFRDDSFIPHNFYGDEKKPVPLVQIGFSKTPKHHQDILLNFTSTVPEFFNQFKHIIEIVRNDPSQQNLARERYRIYRSHGCEINTHKL